MILCSLSLFSCRRALEEELEPVSSPGVVYSSSEDSIAPGIVIALNESNEDDTLVLSWQLPSDADIKGVEIFYARDVSQNFGEFPPVVLGRVNQYEFTDLENGQSYMFRVRVFDHNSNKGHFSKKAYGTPTDINAPSEVTRFRVSEEYKSDTKYSADFSWRNPDNNDFKGVKLVRKPDSPPTDHKDPEGVIVYTGTDESYSDDGLDLGRPYYYAIYAFDEIPRHSTSPTPKSVMIVKK